MSKLSRRAGFILLLGTVSACGMVTRNESSTPEPPAAPAAKAVADAHGPVLKDFQTRLDHYVKTQRVLMSDGPALKETTNPAETNLAQETLAAKIRDTRKAAKQGDIFTPQVATMFKTLIRPEFKGAAGRETKSEIKEEAPTTGEVPLKINGGYPQDQPLSTIPPNVLANLPILPSDVEYRVVGKHLILRDVDANIIVDYVPNAIP